MKSTSTKICLSCGTEFSVADIAKGHCKICEDDRQYVPESGQAWTTHRELMSTHSVQIKAVFENLFELTIIPSFGIGQRAFLLLSDAGNILWDCIPLLDESTIAFINSKGGLKAMAISHPHYYSNMLTWASTFGCPVYIHESDREWVPAREDVQLWKGEEFNLWDGIQIVHIGGHFAGSCVLRVPFLSVEGTLLCGDTLQISKSKKFIALMYSYPNYIPLPVSEIERIAVLLRKYQFDRLYGAFSHQNLTSRVQEILESSLALIRRKDG